MKVDYKKGDKYGELVLIGEGELRQVGSDTLQRSMCVNALCVCGKVKWYRLNNLRRGLSTNCGCLAIKKLKKRQTKHGMSGTQFYNVYHKMKERTQKSSCRSYTDYGGRGIKICKRWLSSFDNFYQDMYEDYKKHVDKNGKENTTLERLNVDGNYTPKNCIWATYAQQMRNKRNSVKYKGENATDASVRLGGNPWLVSVRIAQGWSKKKAFTTEVMRQPYGNK
jgi:hypothetical protein